MARSRSLASLRVGVVLLLSGVIAACGATDSRPRPAVGDITGVAPAGTMSPSLAATQPPAGPTDIIWQRDGAPLQFHFPTGLAADGRGHLYVADAGNPRLQKLTSAGQPVAHWGGSGGGHGQFAFQEPSSYPGDGPLPIGGSIAVDAEGHVYVADPFNARIQAFDGAGQFVTAWGRRGAEVGEFNMPVSVAVDQRGQVYVADCDNHRIQVFDRRGAFLRMWGGQGEAAGQFTYPMAVAVDRRGQVFVADGVSVRIQKFDGAGAFLATWGAAGDRPGEFGGAVVLAVDGEGRVYAADTRNQRVQVFDGEGGFLGQWGGPGGGAGRFAYPGGIAVDERGDIYVADVVNGVIQKFRPRGPWSAAAPGGLTPRPATPRPAPTPPQLPRLTPTDR